MSEQNQASSSIGSRNPAYALWSVLIGFFLITMLMFVVNVALPHIREDLGANESGILWIVNSYTLMLAALLLISGAITDRFGSRDVFGMGMVLFLTASVACAFSPSTGFLIAFRLLQGAAAALMLPSTLSLLREAYTEPAARGRAIGLWATGAAVGSAVGPLIGGAILEFGWRMIFVSLIPFCVISLICLLKVPKSPIRETSFDLVSSILSFVAIFTFIYWLIEGGVRGFTEPLPLLSLVVAIVSGLVFVNRQMYHPLALIPPALIALPAVKLAISSSAAFNFAFTGFIFAISLYLQDVLELSPLETGIALMPVTALAIVVNNISPRVAERIGDVPTLTIGLALMAVGFLVVLFFSRGDSVSAMSLSLASMPMGIGGAMIVPVATQVLASGVPASSVGSASGVLNVSRQLSSALSVALFGVILARASSFSSGFQVCLIVSATVLIITMIFAHTGFRSLTHAHSSVGK